MPSSSDLGWQWLGERGTYSEIGNAGRPEAGCCNGRIKYTPQPFVQSGSTIPIKTFFVSDRYFRRRDECTPAVQPGTAYRGGASQYNVVVKANPPLFGIAHSPHSSVDWHTIRGRGQQFCVGTHQELIPDECGERRQQQQQPSDFRSRKVTRLTCFRNFEAVTASAIKSRERSFLSCIYFFDKDWPVLQTLQCSHCHCGARDLPNISRRDLTKCHALELNADSSRKQERGLRASVLTVAAANDEVSMAVAYCPCWGISRAVGFENVGIEKVFGVLAAVEEGTAAQLIE
ncbi:hypothetical protein SELMODRAFT_427558 [Selaginella moellendorffii]|uniref:Uncharacterized protein n=1 Tax=Selaginella moellendorffii TaxID=88036 RepID=D8SZZ7_SELML|nr:hypothetical protein SELMODRAFT_427558 [Selaginella moellendorffii]